MPVTLRSAAWPKTGSAKLTLARRSSFSRIATGSSGREKGCAAASGGGSARPGGGTARRSQATLPALSRVTFTRPSRSSSRFQSISTSRMRSHGPSVSETVISPMRACEESAPWMPLSADLAAGGGDALLQEADDEAVVVGVVGRLRERGDRHEQKEAEGCRDPSQNACPIPM